MDELNLVDTIPFSQLNDHDLRRELLFNGVNFELLDQMTYSPLAINCVDSEDTDSECTFLHNIQIPQCKYIFNDVEFPLKSGLSIFSLNIRSVLSSEENLTIFLAN